MNYSPGQGPNGDCWEWIGHKDTGGYGLFCTNGKEKIKAHRYSYTISKGHSVNRLSYEWANGEIPEGKQITQSCMNQLCVNPDHLMLINSSAEVKILAGTNFKKLDINTCHKIINKYKEGSTVHQIAKEFDISTSTVSKLINAKYKSIISVPIKRDNQRKGTAVYNSLFTEDQVQEIRKMGDSGVGPTAIVKHMADTYQINTNKSSIANIVARRNYRALREYQGSLFGVVKQV